MSIVLLLVFVGAVAQLPSQPVSAAEAQQPQTQNPPAPPPQQPAHPYDYKHPCEQADDPTKADLCAQWRMAQAAEGQLDLIKLQNLITGIEAALLFASFGFTAWTAREAGRTAKQASDNTQAELRAYMASEPVGLWDGVTLSPPQPLRANTPGAVTAIRNVGKTPAKSVLHWSNVALDVAANPTTLTIPANIQGSITNIAPGAATTASIWHARPLIDSEIADIRAGIKAIYVYGRVTYKDTFGNDWRTNYRLMWTGIYPPPQNAVLTFCPEGNDAD